MTTGTARHYAQEFIDLSAPTSIDWAALIRTSERQGIPVARVDRHGEIHVLRTVEDLADFERRFVR